MRKKFFRIIALIIALTLLLSTAAFAAVNASAYINVTNAWITRDGNTVKVEFYIILQIKYQKKFQFKKQLLMMLLILKLPQIHIIHFLKFYIFFLKEIVLLIIIKLIIVFIEILNMILNLLKKN